MKQWMLNCLAVGMAGFFGSILRFLVGAGFGRLNIRFPFGTLLINITGSLFLGWFMTYIAGHTVSTTTRLAIGVGFVGAYTTFSTYMFESSKLYEEGAQIEATLYLVGSVVLGLLAVRVGIWLGKPA